MKNTADLVLAAQMVLQSITQYQTTPYVMPNGTNGFVYNNFVAARSWIPLAKIEAKDAQEGKVWIIPSAGDDKERVTRRDPSGAIKPLISRDLHVQVAYQQTNVDPDDIAEVDKLVLLTEQLRDVVKNFDYVQPATPSFTPFWCRNEVLKDENGVPFHYIMLREAVTFEFYFTACFTLPHQ